MASSRFLVNSVGKSKSPRHRKVDNSDNRLVEFNSNTDVGRFGFATKEMSLYANLEIPNGHSQQALSHKRKGRETKEGNRMKLRSKQTQEEVLEREVVEFEKHRGVKFDNADRKAIRELLRLNSLFPGEHVAFRDHFQGEGETLRLVRREVLCHSRRLPVIQRFIQNLPADERNTVCMDFIEPNKLSRRR